MSNEELQEEEREVLLSIYEGDSAFNQLSPVTYQYKFGDDGDPKSFLLEISWGKAYPAEKPTLNLDTFYNKHIMPSVKEKISSHILKEADQWLGSAMTYTLFESVKENVDELIAEQPEIKSDFTLEDQESEDSEKDDDEEEEGETKRKDKKDRLSKAQKRKQWDRVDSKGERPRGWNWVDVVKHLSQTGSKQTSDLLPSTNS